MGNQFSQRVSDVIQFSREEAGRLGNNYIGPEHLLLGILREGEGKAVLVLKDLHVDIQKIKRDIESELSTGGQGDAVDLNELNFNNEASKIIKISILEARMLKAPVADTEHLLLAIMREKQSLASNVLEACQVTYAKIMDQLVPKSNPKGGLDFDDEEDDDDFPHRPTSSGNSNAGASQRVNEQKTSSQNDTPVLESFGIDMTRAAAEGKLDPVVGREKEIERLAQILSRRKKNNPILIGEPGVGKSAIVEGLALRIVEKKVSRVLFNKRLMALDMTAVVAGTKYRGQFEERIRSIINELRKNPDIILFIDEIHTLVGAGKGEGAMDAANILKPALARGELRSIGATTLDEYQKYFEKDKALERRFQTVMVNEPDTLSSISILRGLKERYENHHQVRIKDEAIIAAVELSNRYITERFLPDKAIDLMDEAAAKLRMERDSLPEELDEIERRLKQLEIEREAIKREKDEAKLSQLNKEIAELKEQETSYKAKWQSEKELVNKIQHNKQEIEQLKFEADKAEREGDYGKVAEIRYGKLQALENEIKAIQEDLKHKQGDSALIKEEVTAEDIADVVSRWTGIPVSKMLQSEREKLLHLEDELHKRVIGQDEAIQAVADAVRRSRAGLQDPRRPIGSFIFLGTTGVGKTELAKALAEYLFDDDTMMTRIDMSEYQEKHTVSRLIGAPPGYVGYDEGGQLTEAVRRKPYSVVLFDEIEKAHPDVFNILLQVLDDGRLTDNKGRTVNFKNTIIIMTSNLGSAYIQSQFEKMTDSNREQLVEETKNEVMSMLKKTIRPEFLNRIDETIMFLPLNREQIEQIVRLQIEGIRRMLDGNGVTLQMTDQAVDFIATAGYDPEFGARPVKRAIQRYLLNDLSKKLLAQEVDRNRPIIVDSNGDGLVFRN